MNMLGRKMSLRLGLLAAAHFCCRRRRPRHGPPGAPARPVPSLDVVPADAAFYSAMLRNREQFDAVVNSKAFAKIKALPYVQMGLDCYQAQAADPDSPLGQFEAARRDPEVKRSLAFLGGHLLRRDLRLRRTELQPDGRTPARHLRRRVFVRHDGGAHQAQRRKRRTAAAMEDIQGRAFVRALVNQIDLIKFPELVIGCKVKDKALAKEQLGHLESNLQTALDRAPPLQNRLKRTTVGGHSYLTFKLDGSMVPWDPGIVEKIRSLAPTPADGDKLIEHLKKITLVISLGLRDDYLLLAIGPSTDVLARLGNGTPLRSLPELAAVAKFADKRICSVGYLSKTLNQHFSQTKAGIDNLLQTGQDAFCPRCRSRTSSAQEIAKDAAELAADLKTLIPEVGATSSVGFLTAQRPGKLRLRLERAPRIGFLQAAGSAQARRRQPHRRCRRPQQGLARRLRPAGQVDRHRLSLFRGVRPAANEAEGARRVRQGLRPSEAAAGPARQGHAGPADSRPGRRPDRPGDRRQAHQPPVHQGPAADGAAACRCSSRAIVVGVSDAAKLKQAFAEYYAVADDFVEVLKGIEKSEVPKDFKIPRPASTTSAWAPPMATALPAEWGVDSRVLPNAGRVGEGGRALAFREAHAAAAGREGTEDRRAGAADRSAAGRRRRAGLRRLRGRPDPLGRTGPGQGHVQLDARRGRDGA